MGDTRGLPYNNRLPGSSGGGGHFSPTASLSTEDPRLQCVSRGIDLFEHSSQFCPGQLMFLLGLQQDHHTHAENPVLHKMTSFENPIPHKMSSFGDSVLHLMSGFEHCFPHKVTSFEHPDPVSSEVVFADSRTLNGGEASRPVCPGTPRRLSRQNSQYHSANVKRQLFATSPNCSGEGTQGLGQIVTSVHSTTGCDDVFVDMTLGEQAGPQLPPRILILADTSPSGSEKSKGEASLSTSSCSSMLQPNPYNRVNHRIHSALWCCWCCHLLLFCCLPAVHYLKQGDREYNAGNHKGARSLGRTTSFFFFTGTLIAMSVIALILFFAIFFFVYD